MVMMTVYASCFCFAFSALYSVYLVEHDSWLALDKVRVPDFHMTLSNGSSILSEVWGLL